MCVCIHIYIITVLIISKINDYNCFIRVQYHSHRASGIPRQSKQAQGTYASDTDTFFWHSCTHVAQKSSSIKWCDWIGCFKESENHSIVSYSLWSRGLYSPWNVPGQNTGEGSLSLLQGIFPTQGLNQDLPHCRQSLYQLSHKGVV